MQCYFITQAVDILYGMLCARGLADCGTEGVYLTLGVGCVGGTVEITSECSVSGARTCEA